MVAGEYPSPSLLAYCFAASFRTAPLTVLMDKEQRRLKASSSEFERVYPSATVAALDFIASVCNLVDFRLDGDRVLWQRVDSP